MRKLNDENRRCGEQTRRFLLLFLAFRATKTMRPRPARRPLVAGSTPPSAIPSTPRPRPTGPPPRSLEENATLAAIDARPLSRLVRSLFRAKMAAAVGRDSELDGCVCV